MIHNEKKGRTEQVLAVARSMMAAARTAPKAKGIDNLEIITVTGNDLMRLAGRMREMSGEMNLKFFLRDAGNVEQCDAVVIIGTRLGIFSLNCGMCGFPTCAEKSRLPAVPCIYNINDMGIALGSAASIAADHRIDTRIMYSVGAAARSLGMIPADCPASMGILLSCTGKNPFFDRPPHTPSGEQK